MPSIVRFGRTKKSSKPETENANSTPHVPATPNSFRAPRISLPHVDTELNMSQHNGLFAVDSPERLKGPEIVENTMDTISPPPSYISNGSPNPMNGDATAGEWSSAVGHAATGKSGRVIHNLQEDIARLTRECSVYRSRAEETQRMNEAFKTQVQNMTDRLRNLEHSNEMNLHSLSRKEKKIEELRAELQGERDRRELADNEKARFRQLMDEAQDDFHQKCAELQEVAHHSQTQYDVLAKSGQRERSDQQRRLKGIREEFIALREAHNQTNSQLGQLDSVMAQKDREIELERAKFEALFKQYEAYKRAHDEEVRDLIEQNQQGQAKLDAALASLKETEGQMKWVLQVKREVNDAE
ncbi:uncharacterized protein DSM5745_05225 [Aspergillus mulundensis]|uniref:SWI5-dependent HO expression protein 3 n=1 Tax=Aspergillus mulundensis TaxID=1810919 RepID=A0A3D8S5W6_9EURO|nr:SWI5-dependent HO expression protein 3 [Aspergillus mulundensis]RDW81668.1 SWI5-dependent HO expression protein 3 [Aspergillus mulundensis]